LEIAKLGFNIETCLFLPGANLHQKRRTGRKNK